ncbi:hypothetical protein ISR94_02910 [Candidatus Microgenomates bacterium]|nr:hypothetical protein [Candidatus Microgenomates bacterium]
MKKYKILGIVVFLVLSVVGDVLAQARINSDNFTIQFPNFNSGAGIPSSSNYLLDSTLGQGAPGLFSSAGYRVKSGFQYIHSIIPFSFSVSDIQIAFGTLTPDTPSTDTSTLTVSAGGASGYSVTAAENNPLKTFTGGNTIADTTCDGADCDESTATVWSSASIYGFGYNMSGDDVPAGFTDGTYYKQFSDLSLAETPETVMSSVNVGSARSSTIKYKVNVSDVQPGGTYQNIITFVAVPGY